jgi:peptide/nickel transport system ATP-binding protein
MTGEPPLLETVDLRKSFAISSIFGGTQRSVALAGVSITVPAGGAVGLVGESGSGKSTLARCILGLERPDSGGIRFEGRPIHGDGHGPRALKGQIQPIFQNPASSLNPRRKVGDIIAEPLAVHSRLSRAERLAEVSRLLDLVALPRSFVSRYPGQLSGGQCQRVSIARALALRPRLIIADEATSALDVLVQQQVVTLLSDLRREFGIAMLVVSHNLAVTRLVCDEIAVMYQGEIVERGPSDAVVSRPVHPYTQDLIRSVPALTVPEEHVDAPGLQPV